MLTYRRTSLLESTAQTLVNTVNCVGVMGKGIAHEFKRRDQPMFEQYRDICATGRLKPGVLWLWRGNSQWVLNFPTKMHWRNPSKLEWIELGLKKFSEHFRDLNIREISFPRLGCGNGGLNWEDVRPLMEFYLNPLPIHVFVHDYAVEIGMPEHMNAIRTKILALSSADFDFDGFVKALFNVAQMSGDKLNDICDNYPIRAHAKPENQLQIDYRSNSWTLDVEDLWGVWIALQKGLLTKEKAGWSNIEGGRPLLSLISLLPSVRPIEIQGAKDTHPELAIEYVPMNNMRPEVLKQSKKDKKADRQQLDLSWH